MGCKGYDLICGGLIYSEPRVFLLVQFDVGCLLGQIYVGVFLFRVREFI